MSEQRLRRRFSTSELHKHLFNICHYKLCKLTTWIYISRTYKGSEEIFTCRGAFPPPRASIVFLNLCPVSLTACVSQPIQHKEMFTIWKIKSNQRFNMICFAAYTLMSSNPASSKAENASADKTSAHCTFSTKCI